MNGTAEAVERVLQTATRGVIEAPEGVWDCDQLAGPVERGQYAPWVISPHLFEAPS